MRLVEKFWMSSKDWVIYNLLTENAKNKNEWMPMSYIATKTGVSEREVRRSITVIVRKTFSKVVSSNQGYRIALNTKDFEKHSQRQTKRAISSLLRCLDLDSSSKQLFYFILNNHSKDTVVQNQTQIKFTGYERDIVRQFAEDYLSKEEKENLYKTKAI